MAMVISSSSTAAMVRLMPSTATEPLWHHPLAEVFGDADFEGPVGGFAVEVRAGSRDDRVERGQYAGAVDVALHDVAAERAAGGGGQFEIDVCAGGERAERSAVERFLGEIGVEVGRDRDRAR